MVFVAKVRNRILSEMVLACPYNLTTLHYYIITFSPSHFPLSDFRSRNRHLCPPRQNGARMVRLDDGQPPAWPAHLGDRIRGPGEALLDTYSWLSQVILYPFFAFQRKARGISLILQVNGEAGQGLSPRVKNEQRRGRTHYFRKNSK